LKTKNTISVSIGKGALKECQGKINTVDNKITTHLFLVLFFKAIPSINVLNAMTDLDRVDIK
jgi:hypothetical protein